MSFRIDPALWARAPKLLQREAESGRGDVGQWVREVMAELSNRRSSIDHVCAERAQARATVDRLAQILARIHMVIYPKLVTADDGKTCRFAPGDPHEYLQALADKIRAIPDELAAARAAAPAAEPAREKMVRFCPGCGSVGDVPEKFRDCCPDGGHARMIPESLAIRCRDLFRLALKAAAADVQPQPEVQPCGHPASLLITSAETGAPLYCELCDERSRRRDAETREAELSDELRRLKAHPEQSEPSAEQVREATPALVRIVKRDGWYSLTSDIVPGLHIAHPTFEACVEDMGRSILMLVRLNRVDIDAAIAASKERSKA